MTVLIAIAIITALGGPAAWRLRMPGLAFLLGSGILYLAMLPGFHWAVLALIVTAATFLIPRRPPAPVRPHLLDFLTVAYLGAYGLYATAAAPWHWDYWAIWGLKARVFFEHGGVDFASLKANAFAHPDYPLLVPMNFAFPSLLGREWDDRWLGLFMVAFAASLALVARQLAARELTPRFAAAVAFVVAVLASSQYVGLAEVPVIAFGTAGLLLARERDHLLAAMLLGFAASCKNEGFTLLAAATLLRWRLWPGFLVALPWLIIARVNELPADLLAGEPLARVVRAWPVEMLFTTLDKPLCWIAILAALPLTVRRERFVFGVLAIQLAFFLAAYAVTPNNLAWHISTSWDRLSRQLLVPAAYAALIAVAHAKGVAVAEARPEH